MKSMTKLLLLAGASAIATHESVNKIRASFDFDRIEKDFAAEKAAIETGSDGVPVVDHLITALSEAFPEYRRPTSGH